VSRRGGFTNDYANVSMASNNGSPVMIFDDRSSCPSSSESIRRRVTEAGRQHSDSAMLNYADIDLSDSSSPRTPRMNNRVAMDQSMTEYAQLDLIATSAAAQTGRQHQIERLKTSKKPLLVGGDELKGSQTQRGSFRDQRSSITVPGEMLYDGGARPAHRKSSSLIADRRPGAGFAARGGGVSGVGINVKRTQSLKPPPTQ